MNSTTVFLNSRPGTLARIRPDWFVLTDGTAKAVPSMMAGKTISDSSKVKVFIDHETPCGSEAHAQWQKQLIEFATEHQCEIFNGYGISYELMLEKHVEAGNVIAHCGEFGSIYGSVGAYAVKLSEAEMASAIETGEIVVRIPESVHLQLAGSLKSPAGAKDAAIAAVSLLGNTSGKLVMVSGADNLDESERKAFFQLISAGGCEAALPEENCDIPDRTLCLNSVLPSIVNPHDYNNVHAASEMSGTAISAVFIGGCSSGRIEDIRTAAAIAKNRHVQRTVRTTLAFASSEVYIQAANEGLISILLDAGVIVMNQGCSACWAHSQGLVDVEDVVLSAGSRTCPNCNGIGDVTTYLCSAATAMESAISGFITPPQF